MKKERPITGDVMEMGRQEKLMVEGGGRRCMCRWFRSIWRPKRTADVKRAKRFPYKKSIFIISFGFLFLISTS